MISPFFRVVAGFSGAGSQAVECPEGTQRARRRGAVFVDRVRWSRLAAGLLALRVAGPVVMPEVRAAVDIPVSSAASRIIPSAPGDGVFIELFNGIGGGAAPTPADLEGRTPSGTTLSPFIDFPRPGQTVAVGSKFNVFFANTTVPPVQVRGLAARNFTLRIRFFLKITRNLDRLPDTDPIDVRLVVSSDDGFRLTVGNQFLGSAGARGFTPSAVGVRFEDEGLYPVDLLYEANNVGISGLEFRWRVATQTTDVIVPQTRMYLTAGSGDEAITFEELPVGSTVADDYLAQGIRFATVSGALQVTDARPNRFVPVSPTRVFGDPAAEAAEAGVVDLSFVIPGTTIPSTTDYLSFFVIDAEETGATVTAHDPEEEVLFTGEYHGGGGSQEQVILDLPRLARVRITLGEGADTAALDNLAFHTPADLADLVVTSISAPSEALAGQPVTLTWTVVNNGPVAATGTWRDTVLLSEDTLPGDDLELASLPFAGTLAPGEQSSRSRTIILPSLAPGDWHFVVTTDADEELPEGRYEANNSTLATQTTVVIIPDLVVESVESGPASYFGDPITVSWTVRNSGTAATWRGWSDEVLLVTADAPEGPGLSLARFARDTAALGPGGSYTRSETVPLPLNPDVTAGEFILVVRTDLEDAQLESDESNNRATTAAFPLAVPPLPDLQVTTLVAPRTGRPGELLALSYTVVNAGPADALSPWTETVSLVPEPAGSAEILLAASRVSALLPAGSTALRQPGVRLPLTGVPASARVVVRVDAGDAVFEEDEDNNAAATGALLAIQPALALRLSAEEIVESAAATPLRGAVIRSGSVDEAVVVHFTSANPGRLVAPADVTIPGGEVSGSFDLLPVDDDLPNGDAIVRLMVAAPGHAPGVFDVAVRDDDPLRLTLTVPSETVGEGAGTVATVSRNLITSEPLIVVLVSSANARLRPPRTVTIPADTPEVSFVVETPDNERLEPPALATLTAVAPGYASSSAQVTITDNDHPQLAVTTADHRVREGMPGIATMGRVTREPPGGQPLNLQLRSSDPATLIVATGVTIPAGAAAADFLVIVPNNDLAEGPREVSLSAFVADPLSGLPLGPTAETSLTVEDDDSPLLGLEVSRRLMGEGLSPAATGRVSRNGLLTDPLAVSLSTSDPGEATVPATVLIPADAEAVEFAIDTPSDGVTDGSQTVELTASAPGYGAGSLSFVVTDNDLPDLTVVDIAFAEASRTGGWVEVAFRLVNQGLAPFVGAVTQRVLLSPDRAAGGDTAVAEREFSGVLGPGEGTVQSVRFRAPGVPGDYWIAVLADATGQTAEAVERNNLLLAATPLRVTAAYTVAVTSELTEAAAGTAAPLVGEATDPNGAPAAGVPVQLWIDLRGARRTFNVLTDAQGQFSFVFRPLPTEAGRYEVRAVPPGAVDGLVQHEFTLHGMRFEPASLSVRVPGLSSVNRSVELVNAGEVPLTGLQATVVNPPPTTRIDIALPDGLAGFERVPVQVSVASEADVALNGTSGLRITSAEGGTVELPLNLTVLARRARLTTQPGRLTTGMIRGEQTIVQFTVANEGGDDSGLLHVALPEAPWLRLLTPNPLPGLAPGEGGVVTLQLVPGAEFPLGEQQGALVVQGTESSVAVPFSFRCVSTAVGDLAVEVEDEFTYYAEGAPRVADAEVTLRDADTGEVVTRAITDETGHCLFTGIPEAHYLLEIKAEDHVPGRETLLLKAGETNEIQAFVSREVVRYFWTVRPIDLEDRTRITIRTEFETVVPVPVITVDPPLIDLADLAVGERQIDLKISNHGLIAANGLTLEMPGLRRYRFETPTRELGTLAAQSSITVPVVIRKVEPPAVAPASPPAAGLTSVVGGDPCSASLAVRSYLICGSRKNGYRVPVPVINLEGDCSTRLNPSPGFVNPYPLPPDDRGGSYQEYRQATPVEPGKLRPFTIRIAHESANACEPCNPETYEPSVILSADFSYLLETVVDAVKPFVEQLPFVEDVEGESEGEGVLQTCCKEDGGIGLEGAASGKASLTATFVVVGGSVEVPKVNVRDPAGNHLEIEGKLFGGVKVEVTGSVEGSATTGCNFENPAIQAAAEFSALVTAGVQAGVEWVITGPEADLLEEDQRKGEISGELTLNTGGKISAAYNSDEGLSVDACFEGLYLVGKVSVETPILSAEWPPGDENTFYFIPGDCPPEEEGQAAVSRYYAFDEDTRRLMEVRIEEAADRMTDHIRKAERALAYGRPVRPAATVPAAVPDAGVCARVRLQLNQDLIMTRSAFEATLEIVNGSPQEPLENINVQIGILDRNNRNGGDRFALKSPELRGITGVDGQGLLPAGTTGRASWILIPNDLAAPDEATDFTIGGYLSYTLAGQRLVIPLEPVPVTVFPQAKLQVQYFHQRDVLGDDPFTPGIEPSVPFALGVLVKNVGRGPARDVRIVGAQPRIIENQKGLLIDFQLLGTQVGGQARKPALSVALGQLEPGALTVGQWFFESSLQGQFIDYEAGFEHIDALGDPRLSLIDRVEIHELIHAVRALHPADDGLPDFLVNDVPNGGNLPDTLYLSQGAVRPVRAVQTASHDGPPGGGEPSRMTVTLSTSVPAGWAYLRVPDPAEGRFRLVRVERSDGGIIPLDENVWVSDRTFIENSQRPLKEFVLHLLDFDSPGSYTLTYEPLMEEVTDTDPPVSQVAALPAMSTRQFTLIWSGQDLPGGSGLERYDLFVSEDDGPFIPWLQGTKARSGVFAGVPARHYAFYSIATDKAGNREVPPTAPDAQTTTTGNTPPAIDAIPLQTITEGNTVSLQVHATDSDLPGDKLTYRLAQAPGGMVIDLTTGLINWVTGEAHGGRSYPITVRVDDNAVPSLTAEGSFSVKVEEQNSAPRLPELAGSYAIDEHARLRINLAAQDADLPPQQMRYSALPALPAGAALNASSGLFTWTPDETMGGTSQVLTVQVLDSGDPPLSDSRSLVIDVAELNSPPVLGEIADQILYEGDLLSLQPTGSDSDLPANQLRYELDAGGPGGAMVDPLTGLVTWEPVVDQIPGSGIITLRLTDDGEPPLAAVRSFRVEVLEIHYGLNLPRFLPGGELEMRFKGEPGQDYVLEISSDLVEWSPLESFTATDRIMQLIDPAPAAGNYQFYRTRP